MAELAVAAVQGLAIGGKGSGGTYPQKDGEADIANVRRHKNLLSTSEPEIRLENQLRYFLVAIFSNYIYPVLVCHAVIQVTQQWFFCREAWDSRRDRSGVVRRLCPARTAGFQLPNLITQRAPRAGLRRLAEGALC